MSDVAVTGDCGSGFGWPDDCCGCLVAVDVGGSWWVAAGDGWLVMAVGIGGVGAVMRMGARARGDLTASRPLFTGAFPK